MSQGRSTAKKRLEKAGFNSNPISTTRYGDDSTRPPPNVATDPAAMACWEACCRALIDTGRWQASDAHALQRLCVNHSVCVSLEKAMLDAKVVSQRQSGNTAVSPVFLAYQRASDTCLRLERSLGLSPAARSAQGVATVDEADELESFLREQE